MDRRVALITGGASGIGRCVAQSLAARGVAVAMVDYDRDGADAVASGIVAAGGRAAAYEANVAVASEVERAVHAAVAEFGRLDVVCNNAGTISTGSVLDAGEDDWDRCFAVNAKGTFLVSRAAIPALRAAGGGAIVNVASIAALVGMPTVAAYCASKGAVVALTRSMAVDLAQYGIRVNAVCPGTVLTPMAEQMMVVRGGGDRAAGIAQASAKYPIGRLGTPAEIADVVCFLAGPGASFVTGAVLAADGGLTAQ